MLTFCVSSRANTYLPNALSNISFNNYQAVVLGKMIKKEVKKINTYYITEYRLKAKEWFFKKPDIKETKFITIKILGAELSDKGIVIKASTSPSFVPMDKEAIFLLENTKSKQKNVYTIGKDGIIYNEI